MGTGGGGGVMMAITVHHLYYQAKTNRLWQISGEEGRVDIRLWTAWY